MIQCRQILKIYIQIGDVVIKLTHMEITIIYMWTLIACIILIKPIIKVLAWIIVLFLPNIPEDTDASL